MRDRSVIEVVSRMVTRRAIAVAEEDHGAGASLQRERKIPAGHDGTRVADDVGKARDLACDLHREVAMIAGRLQQCIMLIVLVALMATIGPAHTPAQNSGELAALRVQVSPS
jgi:hypothetical protein